MQSDSIYWFGCEHWHADQEQHLVRTCSGCSACSSNPLVLFCCPCCFLWGGIQRHFTLLTSSTTSTLLLVFHLAQQPPLFLRLLLLVRAIELRYANTLNIANCTNMQVMPPSGEQQVQTMPYQTAQEAHLERENLSLRSQLAVAGELRQVLLALL